MRAVYGAVVVVTAVFTLTAPVSGSVAQVAGFLVVLVASAVRVWWRGFDRPTLIAVQGSLALAVLWPTATSAGDWWCWQPWVTACVLTGAVCRLGGTVAVTALSSTAYLVARLDVDGSLVPALSEVVSGWQAALLVCLVLRAWRRIAEVGDRSARAEVDEAVCAARVTALDRAEQDAARALHNHVLHTLRAAGSEDHRVTPADLIRMGHRALAAFDPQEQRGSASDTLPDAVMVPAPGFDLVDGLRRLTHNCGLDVRFRVDTTGAPGPLPEPVARALLDAAEEGLRNVRRHADVTTATVTVRCRPDRFEVQIIDAGTGFDSDMVSPRSRGLVDSVVGAMVAVGGGAAVRTATGDGTVVTLHWPAGPTRPRARIADLMVELGHARRDLLVAVVVPEAGGGVLRCALWMHTTPAPAVVGLSLTLALAALVSVAAPIWSGRAPTRRRAALAALLGVAAIGVSSPALSPGVTASSGLATVEVVAPVVMMIAWQWRFRVALAVGTTVALTATITAVGSTPGPLGYLPLILLCPLAAVELAVLRRFVAADAGRVQTYYRARRETARALADAADAHRSASRRMARLRPQVLPTLVALASGQFDRHDPAGRAGLGELEAAIRDDLQLGGCLSSAARTLIDRARRAGTTVDVIGPAGRELDTCDDVDVLVRLGLESGRLPSHMTLTAARNPDGTSTVALLVRPGLPSSVTRPTPPIVDTADLTLVRVHGAAGVG